MKSLPKIAVQAFDNEKYLAAQKAAILNRLSELSCDKLYIEIGGKFIDDMHASRVLPGFDPGSKALLASTFNGSAELILCINSNHIEQKKVRADNSLSYDREVMRLIDEISALGIKICGVVITLFAGQKIVKDFGDKLTRLGQDVHYHYFTKGYPTDIETIVSEKGYGVNDYVKSSKKIVFVAAPGPASGKLSVCLSQLYFENKNGVKAGYAKYETFPVWNLPLKHPVNVAYEASTADLGDVNAIDHFHLNATGEVTINYNRDIESFPVLDRILHRIVGKSPYKSPTQMGVNCVKEGIVDMAAVERAASVEIYRRLLRAEVDVFVGLSKNETLLKNKMLASDSNADENCYPVKTRAEKEAAASAMQTFAIELPGGKIVVGKAKKYLSAASACILNSVKELCGMEDELYLITEEVLRPILKLKTDTLKKNQVFLQLEDTLIALAVSGIVSVDARRAVEKLTQLAGLSAHSSVILNESEKKTLRNLKIEFTQTPVYSDDKVFKD